MTVRIGLSKWEKTCENCGTKYTQKNHQTRKYCNDCQAKRPARKTRKKHPAQYTEPGKPIIKALAHLTAIQET